MPMLGRSRNYIDLTGGTVFLCSLPALVTGTDPGRVVPVVVDEPLWHRSVAPVPTVLIEMLRPHRGPATVLIAFAPEAYVPIMPYQWFRGKVALSFRYGSTNTIEAVPTRVTAAVVPRFPIFSVHPVRDVLVGSGHGSLSGTRYLLVPYSEPKM